MKQLYTCSVCGAEAHWGAEWEWFGSIRDLDDGVPVVKTCSRACRLALRKREGGPGLLAAELRAEYARVSGQPKLLRDEHKRARGARR